MAIHSGKVTVTDSTLSGNLAQAAAGSTIDGTAYGGAIEDGAAIVITNCTIDNNRCIGGDNSADGYAQSGGVNLVGGGAVIAGTTFSGNVSLGGSGGTGPNVGEAQGAALATFGPGAGQSLAPVTVTGCTFVANETIAGSGGNSGPGNTDPGVDESFGTIFNFGDSLTVSDTSFLHNQVRRRQ